MNRVWRILLILSLLLLGLVPFTTSPILSSGTDTWSMPIDGATNAYSSSGGAVAATWATAIADTTGSNGVASIKAGYSSGTTGWSGLYQGGLGIDAAYYATAPALGNVVGMRVNFRIMGTIFSTFTIKPTWRLYKALRSGGTGAEWDINDLRAHKDYPGGVTPISNAISFVGKTVGDWVTFTIEPEDYAYMMTMTNDQVDFALETVAVATNVEPAYIASKYELYEFGSQDTTGYEPILEIDYVADTTTRGVTVPSNAAVNGAPTGLEVVTDVGWGSPRTAYADELLYFVVTGESGATATLRLVDYYGKVWASRNDSVRTNGFYYWSFPVPTGLRGYLRAEETKSGFASEWGYSASAPATSELNMSIQVNGTAYPDFRRPFKDYVASGSKPFLVHWKTNITSSELANNSLSIRYLGSTPAIWTTTFASLASGYFLNTVANDGMLGWRYALFAFNGSGNDFISYDSLVIDLSRPYSSANSGFYQPVILEATTEVTQTYSLAWLLLNVADGVTITESPTKLLGGEDVTWTVSAGAPSKALGYLPNDAIIIYDSDDNAVFSDTFSLTASVTRFTTPAPVVPGTYYARVGLQTTTADAFYTYEMDLEVATAGPGGGAAPGIVAGWGDSIALTMESFGLADAVGKWLLILTGMVFAFWYFRNGSFLKIVMPLMVFGLGILIGWVDVWIIILLTLVASIGVFSWFRKKVQGGGD